MRKMLISLCLILSSFIAVPAFAEFKLATIDVNRVLNESKEAVAKRREIENKGAELRKKLEERGRKLKEAESRLKESGAAEDSKDAEKFKNDARNFEHDVKDAQEDLRNQFLKLNKGLADKAIRIINDYAKANRIDLVLDRNDKTRGVVLFGSPAIDITEQVLAKMNE